MYLLEHCGDVFEDLLDDGGDVFEDLLDDGVDDVFDGRSEHGFLCPAFLHDLVHPVWTAVWLCQCLVPLQCFQQLQYMPIHVQQCPYIKYSQKVWKHLILVRIAKSFQTFCEYFSMSCCTVMQLYTCKTRYCHKYRCGHGYVMVGYVMVSDATVVTLLTSCRVMSR